VYVNLESANLLRNRIATILDRDDFGSLTILFSSEDGSTDHSLELFNLFPSFSSRFICMAWITSEVAPCRSFSLARDGDAARSPDSFSINTIGVSRSGKPSTASTRRLSALEAISIWHDKLSNRHRRPEECSQREGRQPRMLRRLPDGRGGHSAANVQEILRLIAELRPQPPPASA
jgi:hypothetical protein